MTGRRSERSRVGMDYSKLNSADEDINQDDDDFMKATPPKKKRKQRKSETTSVIPVVNEKQETLSGRKALNRLSEEEKYNLQLEKALKLSIAENGSQPDNDKNALDSISDKRMPLTLTVHADVTNSPNSKENCNFKAKKTGIVNSTKCVTNGAIYVGEDQIKASRVELTDLRTDHVNRRSSRKGSKVNKDEEEYQVDGESESEDASDDSETIEDDFKNATPKRKSRKKTAMRKEKIQERTTARATTGVVIKQERPQPPLKQTVKPVSNLPKTVAKPLSVSSPCTPRSRPAAFLGAKSPNFVQRRFSQPGWTPPGPAGSKAAVLKSSPSPGSIRVGLSRNVRVTPLHPRTNLNR